MNPNLPGLPPMEVVPPSSRTSGLAAPPPPPTPPPNPAEALAGVLERAVSVGRLVVLHSPGAKEAFLDEAREKLGGFLGQFAQHPIEVAAVEIEFRGIDAVSPSRLFLQVWTEDGGELLAQAVIQAVRS